jgi:phosphatidylinositol alpha-1,6-mannosyltransferase
MEAYREVIATSETYRRKSSILRSLGSKVKVVNNGVDCERFHPDVGPTTIVNRFGIKGKLLVLFVGALTRWHGYKGLDVLLRAMQLVVKSKQGIVLLVVGEGDMRARYEFMANQLGLRDNVIFAGDVPDQELPKFYAASDLVVVPSKDMSEGFGLTVLEANASSRPSVASNVGGIPEVVRDGYNGLLVSPNDVQALAEGILSLATDQDARLRMGRNGRVVALAHDWKVVAEKTEGVYALAISR